MILNGIKEKNNLKGIHKGVVTYIDDEGKLFGDWGYPFGIVPSLDTFLVIRKKENNK